MNLQSPQIQQHFCSPKHQPWWLVQFFHHLSFFIYAHLILSTWKPPCDISRKNASGRHVQKRISAITFTCCFGKPQVLLSLIIFLNYIFFSWYFFWSMTLFWCCFPFLLVDFCSSSFAPEHFSFRCFFLCLSITLLRLPARLPPTSQVGLMFLCTVCTMLRSHGCTQRCWIWLWSLNLPKWEWAIDTTDWVSENKKSFKTQV